MIHQIKASYVRESSETYSVLSPNDVVSFWRNIIEHEAWYDSEKECVVVLCLDTAKNVKAYNIVSIGTINQSFAGPREILKPALLCSAAAIVLIHNHPSGNPSPSRADHDVTKRLSDACKIMEIEMSDHVIIGSGYPEYFSFRESGLI